MLLIFYYKVTNTIILLIFNEKLKFNRKVFIQPPRHEEKNYVNKEIHIWIGFLNNINTPYIKQAY